MSFSYRRVLTSGGVLALSLLIAYIALNPGKAVSSGSGKSKPGIERAWMANPLLGEVSTRDLTFGPASTLSITPADISHIVGRAPGLKQALATLSTKAESQRRLSNHARLSRRTTLSHHSRNQNPDVVAGPVLITESDTARAIAVETTTRKREPFFPLTSLAWGPDPFDRHTRVSLFAMNVGTAFGDSPATLSVD